MGYKKKDTKAGVIGKELRVGALVEGSVRKAGNKIRVTAQLINANTEGHLWSSKYDRDFQDIFSVQTDIAEQVAKAATAGATARGQAIPRSSARCSTAAAAIRAGPIP